MHWLAGRNLNATRLHSKNFYSDKYQTLIAQQYLFRITQPLHAPKLRGKTGPCVASSVETSLCTHLIDFYFWIWICTVLQLCNEQFNEFFVCFRLNLWRSRAEMSILMYQFFHLSIFCTWITVCRIYLMTIIVDVRILNFFVVLFW